VTDGFGEGIGVDAAGREFEIRCVVFRGPVPQMVSGSLIDSGRDFRLIAPGIGQAGQ
jgi:hypothetical protein